MPRRYLCSVLDEMRDCIKTLNFSYLLGLIEEAQVLGNRMEAALGSKDEIKRREERIEELRKEKKTLQEEIGLLKKVKAKKK